MELIYTRHALDAMEKRGISEAWIQRAIEHPQRVEPDRLDPTLIHYLCAIPENGGRVLRVVLNSTNLPPKLVTVFFDRKMKGKL